jgi:hypothetical protein
MKANTALSHLCVEFQEVKYLERNSRLVHTGDRKECGEAKGSVSKRI